MYYKIINDRTVFSDCKIIQLSNGRWVSNPSAETIAQEGWTVYVPPAPQYIPEEEPDMMDILSAVKKMLANSTESLTDEEALEVAALFPTWHSKLGETIPVGKRLWYDGKLYKVVQSHTIQGNWTPDISTSLFTEVSIEEFPA